MLTDVCPLGSASAEEVLALATAVESGSEHPLAHAVVEAAQARALRVVPARDIEADPGRGVRGTVDGSRIEVARIAPASRELNGTAEVPSIVRRLEFEGKSCATVARDGSHLGVLAFRDEIAAGVPDAVRALHEDGLRLVMVTGDAPAAALSVARPLGISEVHSEMTPAGKLELIRRFRAEGHHVAFVGDGINDAPALAGADLGIAIGSGTDVAREAGGVVLIRSDFRGVALALRLARRTVRKVRGNLTWAIGYNAVLLPVAMGALVPLFGLSIYNVLPVFGAVAMGLSSTTVVANSLSLRWVALGRGGSAPRSRVTSPH